MRNAWSFVARGAVGLLALVCAACAADPVYRGYAGRELPPHEVARLVIHGIEEVRTVDGELVELERFGTVSYPAQEPLLELRPGSYRIVARRNDCFGSVHYRVPMVTFELQVVAGRRYEERTQTDRGWVDSLGFCAWVRHLAGPYELPVYNLHLAVFELGSRSVVAWGKLLVEPAVAGPGKR